MTKRFLIPTIGMILLAGCAAVTPHQQAARRPNILIILADDMGYSDLGCYGSEISTPNIDALAAGGVRFTQFYNTARCCPTRAALLTGLYSHMADVGHMTGDRTNVQGYHNDLSHDAVTIAEVMRAAGYATCMTGKWHVTSNESPGKPMDNWPRQRGFERYYGTIMGGGSYYDPAMLVRDNTMITPQSDPEYRPGKGGKGGVYYTDALADQSARFIREHHERDGNKPLFMYVAFTSPHWPLHAPEDAIAKYKGRYDAGYEPIRAARFSRMKEMGLLSPAWELSPAPASWESHENKAWEARCMEVYAAQIDRMDQGVGRIVAALKEAGEFDSTLILFLSDNGGCAEPMGRFAQPERMRATETQPMRPDEEQVSFYPKYTRDGRPVRNGKSIMPGADDTFIAYGQNWANVSNTPFRQYKHWVHEGGISTPLIAHWPARITRHGEFERQPGHVIDLMATCVDLGQAEYPKKAPPMAGASLAPAFAGGQLHRKAPIFFEHEGNRAVRAGQWKLVAKGKTGPWELYDMEADRTEMHDLASQHPDRVAEMAGLWEKWAQANYVLPMNPWEKKKPGE
jgi:arylsulfatase A-like enzyme